MISSIKETCQESTEKLKEQKDKVLKSSTEGMEIVTHWLEDKMTKRIYEFREGSKNDENILGQKGASLCELWKMGIKVPPGFVITSDTCKDFFKGEQTVLNHLFDSLKSSVSKLEHETGKSFFFTDESQTNSKPLLLSVRSSVVVEMPRIMDSILNVGVNDSVIQRLISITSNPKFAYDVQRRFLQQFGTVVLKISKDKYVKILDETKSREGVSRYTELSSQALQSIVHEFKQLGEIPSDPFEQLKMTVKAIFNSWSDTRAKDFRNLHHISDDLGTAIVVQSMVFGNINSESCVGKLFTRNPDTGLKEIYGEYVPCVQGDDVSDGFDETAKKLEEFQTWNPNVFSELKRISGVLESFFGDAQEIEFTLENGELFVLESVRALRSPLASVKIAVDLALNNQLTERESILRIDSQQMEFFLHPTVSEEKEKDISHQIIGKGLASTLGSVAGKAVFHESDAQAYRNQGIQTILILNEGSMDDISALENVDGLLLMHGGVTNPILDVARLLDKTVITGAACGGLSIDCQRECVYDGSGKTCIEKGQTITLDGATGNIIDGSVVSIPTETQSDFRTLMRWTDKYRRVPLFVSAKTWQEVYRSLELRSNGVGLLEIENFFFNSDRLLTFQAYLFTDSKQMREDCLQKLQEALSEDFKRIFRMMSDKRVSIRLFNSTSDEFFPTDSEAVANLARYLSLDTTSLAEKISAASYSNPLLGIRGVRCSLMHPSFLQMQIRAIFSARSDLERSSNNFSVQILVPMLTSEHEVVLERVVKHIHETAQEHFTHIGSRFPYDIGAIIETPRACLCADRIARTNCVSSLLFNLDQLTELVLGISKCDSHRISHAYSQEGISKDPFWGLDRSGVGKLVSKGIELIRSTPQSFQIGVYGSQLRSRTTLEYLNKLGVDFIVCSISQLPAVKVASAQAEILKIPHSNLEKYWPPHHQQHASWI